VVPGRLAAEFNRALLPRRYGPPPYPLRTRFAAAARDAIAGVRYGYHGCCIARYVWDTLRGRSPARALYLRQREFYEFGPLCPDDIWPGHVPCRRHERLGLARALHDIERGHYSVEGRRVARSMPGPLPITTGGDDGR
jgi:hypothetical protein